MINNRQGGNRRRGRGGQQTRNGQPGNPHSNSRLDNRQRGNAAQLLEKYKTLARDAQMQGDRVNSEYYLQFADHYFRVLSESRTRAEEPRRARDEFGQDYGAEDDGGEPQRAYAPRDFSDDGWDEAEEEREAEAQARAEQPQARPEPRGFDPRAGDRNRAYQPRANGGGAEASGNRANGAGGQDRAAANGGNGGSVEAAPDEPAPRIAYDRLPPALTTPAADQGPAAPEPAVDGEEAPAPKRRRGRKPKLTTDTAPADA